MQFILIQQILYKKPRAMNSRYNSEENKVGELGFPKAQIFRPQELRQYGAGGGQAERAAPPDGQRPLLSEVALRMTAYSHCLWENCSLR